MYKLNQAHKEGNYTPSNEPLAPFPQTAKPGFCIFHFSQALFAHSTKTDESERVQWRSYSGLEMVQIPAYNS